MDFFWSIFLNVGCVLEFDITFVFAESLPAECLRLKQCKTMYIELHPGIKAEDRVSKIIQKPLRFQCIYYLYINGKIHNI